MQAGVHARVRGKMCRLAGGWTEGESLWVRASVLGGRGWEVERVDVCAWQKSLKLWPCLANPGLCWGRSSNYAAAKAEFDEKYGKQQAVLAKLRADKLLDMLGVKTNEAEQSSDELQDKFLAGDLPLDSFVDTYLKQRVVYHQRDLKRQAASQQLL